MLEREIIEMVWKHLTLATMHLFCCAFVQNNANPLEVLENILGIPFTLLNKFSPPVTDLPSVRSITCLI